MEPSPFFNPYAPLTIHERNLPHWDQAGVWVFLTWRLADALPSSQLADWHTEQVRWLAEHPNPWTEGDRVDYRRRFPARLEKWLDEGQGECWLRQPELSAILADTLQHFDEDRYVLRSFVVMPNHVHVLVRLREDQKLAQTVKSWKTWAARELNRALGRAGRVWQPGYWDRLVRDERHLYRCEHYIAQNPRKANLISGEYRLWPVPEGDGTPGK